MELQAGRPLRGGKLEATKAFLARMGLDWEPGNEVTFNMVENGNIYATGSRQGNVLKCIGVSCKRQGEGLSATILTELTKDALRSGYSHLFLYTKPDNIELFGDSGFYLVSATKDVCLMENRKNGIRVFVNGLQPKEPAGDVGAVVVNCNPFTLGHRYLIESALARCDFLHIFVLSEDKSMFDTQTRLQLVKEGVKGLSRCAVHLTGDYLISSATFPQYFLKEKGDIGKIQCELDLQIFGEYFVPALGISKRFVGSEPYCSVTSVYNQQMKEILPRYGVEVLEIPRVEEGGRAISASLVRELYAQGRFEEMQPLVPESTFLYLKEHPL